MDDDHPGSMKRRNFEFLLARIGAFWKTGRAGKTNRIKIILIIILALGARLFFSVLWEQNAFAQKTDLSSTTLVSLAILPGEKKTNYAMAKTFSDKEAENICSGNELNQQAETAFAKKYRLQNLVKGYPIYQMIGEISQRDEKVAAFLIGIAKKESDWGKHSPGKNGRDCFNYWGYKGSYNLTDSGYSCFDSPAQAVKVVGDRLSDLIGKKIDTPKRMVVWKCGSSCSGHDPKAVAKWISDVSHYFYELT